jgi:hypothetical protein
MMTRGPFEALIKPPRHLCHSESLEVAGGITTRQLNEDISKLADSCPTVKCMPLLSNDDNLL